MEPLNRPAIRQLGAVLACVAACVLPLDRVRPCGPMNPRKPAFTFSHLPDLPLEGFAEGRLGIVQPNWARSYLAVAYRQLTAGRLTAEERASVLSLWNRRLYGAHWREATAKWKDARRLVNDPPRLERSWFYVGATCRSGEYHEPYLNCGADGFRTAIATLRGLVERYGADSAVALDWLRAQDAVFSCCQEELHDIPTISEAVLDQDPWTVTLVRHHRRYQRAAALFYAGRWDEARRRFLAIAHHPTSPWAQTARLVAARCLLRDGFLGADCRRDSAALEKAHRDFSLILKDPRFEDVHDDALEMIRYLELRQAQYSPIQRLADEILDPDDGVPLGRSVEDLTYLLDTRRYFPDLSEMPDLVRWTFGKLDTKGYAQHQWPDDAVASWREHRSLPWLIAALWGASKDDAAASELLAATTEVPKESPGWASVLFYSGLLMDSMGRREEARGVFNRLLEASDLPGGSRNLVKAARLRTARTLHELVTDLPRSVFCKTRIRMENADECSQGPGRSALDRDGADVLTWGLPLSVLIGVVDAESLPRFVRAEIARAGWVRAVLIGDHRRGLELARRLVRLKPEMQEPFVAYLEADTEQERVHAMIDILVWFPNMDWQVEHGVDPDSSWIERSRSVGRSSWWRPAKTPSGYRRIFDGLPPLRLKRQRHQRHRWRFSGPSVWTGLRQSPIPYRFFVPPFLDASQRADLKREIGAVAEIGPVPNELCRLVLEWAEEAPDDPRVPPALHRAVVATRWVHGDENTGDWSRRAFRLLHRRYPKSPWTEKTPYWYD